ncbi:hypothetical protein B0T17DRAFT_619781 [Bombardia bombarda]|uniref:JmjC domain-containing protein n=1 Tax=Bombardia bombarda TaxID=252184 RepID=A0AA39WGG7_9PEZI|nr:hypothetical protein B0T17DRAFT_619781 [Bombardia bombarda]
MRNSHGEFTNALMYKILKQSKQPVTDPTLGQVDAHFLSPDEAAARVESHIPDSDNVPILTNGALHFPSSNMDSESRKRDNCDNDSDSTRPISQFFDWMEDLDRTVSVQIPSRRVDRDSFEPRKLAEIKRRFLDRKETNNPWNILDVANPVPAVLPEFLRGLNCQLLLRIRDVILMGDSAERPLAQREEWSTWRDVLEWGLLSEGGHNTAPHTDSHGLETWITVQEGLFGFGWLSRPTREQRDEWMQDPQEYTKGDGRWRYVVLKPAQTIFFPSGTIHFVFRLRSEQTLALGGHVLRWSGIERWLRVVIDQVRHPRTTNEEISESVPSYVAAVVKLLRGRLKRGGEAVSELGGIEVISSCMALVKEFNMEYQQFQQTSYHAVMSIRMSQPCGTHMKNEKCWYH